MIDNIELIMSWTDRYFMIKEVGFWAIIGLIIVCSIVWFLSIAIEEKIKKIKQKRKERKGSKGDKKSPD